ncbi:MAG: DUF3800 domain-containing protein [Candidatus Methanoplasma sp.]|jgi:hypothetical protein|nr:DUF3800 domain-containing protein [Candidatus Methanoplasma sp.]
MIDESGDSKPRKGQYFTMTASVTDDPGKFAEIAERARKELNQEKELKFKDTRPEPRKKILREIAGTGAEMYAVVAAEEDISLDPVDAHRSAFGQLADIVLESLKGEDVTIKVDENNKAKGGVLRKIVSESSKKHGVNTIDVKVTKSIDDSEMQAQDSVAGAVGKKYNGPNRTDEYANELPKLKIHRVKLK